MADAPKTLDDVELPDTKPYRVAMMGATYNRAYAAYGALGPTLIHSNELAMRGDVIQLDAAQARRMLDLGAVKETDDPRSYSEMTPAELFELAKRRGVDVRSTSLAADRPLAIDAVNALNAYDAGVGSLVPVQSGPLAVASPVPVPGQNPGAGNAAPGEGESEKVTGAPDATGSNVNALAEYVKRVRPTNDDMVAIAQRSSGGPQEGARAALDAEEVATGGDPRATLVPRLQAIIDGEGV